MADINPYATQDGGDSAVLGVTYSFIIVTLLFTTLRVSLSWLRKRAFGWDDILLISATPLALLSAICVGNAVVNGLGRTIAFVHSGQLSNYFKLSYASQILNILAIAASKHSVVALVQRLIPYNAPAQRYVRPTHFLIGSWMLFSIFGIAFQCGVPAPWIYQPTRCTGHGAIWYPVVALSIVTDLMLAAASVPIMMSTNLDARKKRTVISIFFLRSIVPVFAIAEIAVLAPVLAVEDQTAAMTIPMILGQVTMNLSILTAALPALSRTISSLEYSSSAAVVSEITAVPLDATHNRSTSAENNKLRDWAFAQLRNSPTPNSLTKDISLESRDSPRKPEKAQLQLERVDTAPPVPARSTMRSNSPRLTLNFDNTSPGLDVKEAWFVDSNRSSTMTDLSTDLSKRMSARNDIAC